MSRQLRCDAPPALHPTPPAPPASYHEGGPADSRMTAAARARGIKLTSLSRPLTPQDLAEVRQSGGRHAPPVC